MKTKLYIPAGIDVKLLNTIAVLLLVGGMTIGTKIRGKPERVDIYTYSIDFLKKYRNSTMELINKYLRYISGKH